MPLELPIDMPGPEAFPPLGSARPAPSSNMTGSRTRHQQNRGSADMSVHNAQNASAAAQDFFSRSRGRGRGRGQGRAYRQPHTAGHDFARPPAQQNHRWSSQNQFLASQEQNRAARHRAMDQADYLDYLAKTTMTNMLTRKEIESKHLFRQRLEALAKNVSETSPLSNTTSGPLNLRLQSYGSLSNSFGTSGCDVDLLLTVETKAQDYVEISEQYKRDLEKALLEKGIGARLLTNTRIPIIRVCERPSAELLENLWEHRRQREITESIAQLRVDSTELDAPLPILTKSQYEAQSAAMAELDLNAADVPLPQTPVIDHAKLEFVGDCGIQCDINFTNHVALHNTKMLWTYGQCDTRVRLMGIFVKNWVKARAINTPYHGTLSSYGFVLMVLHYLMNVTNPPVVPNLQGLAHGHLWGQPPTRSSEGHDIEFTHDLDQIRDYMATQPRNQNSLGALLQGFFRYYATHDGFNWTQDVISIRTPGGILSKQAKGWTGAKWTGNKQNVRLRYLLAIEDPFELEHNVARTVGHNGIKAIRDEFRRSWSMIQGIQRVQSPQGTSWIWSTHDQNASGDGLDFIAPAEDRGDLLKRDAEFRKEQLKLLKQKTEADEESAKRQALKSVSDDELADTYGMSVGQSDLLPIDTWAEDQAKLIHDVALQDKKISRMRGPKTIHRKPTSDKDDSDSEDPMHYERYATENGKAGSVVADERATSPTEPDTPEFASEGLATPDGTSSSLHMEPYVDKVDQTFADSNKITSGQDQWDIWGHGVRDQHKSFGQDEGRSNCNSTNNLVQTDWNEYRDAQAIKNVSDDHANNLASNDTTLNIGLLPSPSLNYNNDLVNGNGNVERNSSVPLSPRTKRQLRSSLPPPRPLDNIPRPSQDTPAQRLPSLRQYRQAPTSDSVGPIISWTPDAMGGRWLLSRDRRIRQGQTVELTSGDKGRLNAKFPYNPSMTREELAEKNDLLEKYYKDSLYPRQSAEMRARSSGAGSPVIEAQSAVHENAPMDTNREPPVLNIDKIIDAGPVGDGIYWSTMTDIGHWLRWRDRKIIAGRWKPKDSLAALLSDLFPRDATTTVGDMNCMNWDLDNFFVGLSYPRAKELTHDEMDEMADAIRDAVRKTYEHRASKQDAASRLPRKAWNDFAQLESFMDSRPRFTESTVPLTKKGNGDETKENLDPSARTEPVAAEEPVRQDETVTSNEQRKLLLDMFRQGDVSPKTTRHVLDPKDQNAVEQLSMQAMMNVSEQASKGLQHNNDFVRAQRVAFFDKQSAIKNQSVPMASRPLSEKDVYNFIDERKDSGVEGSCNQSSPSSNTDLSESRHLNYQNLTNLQKALKNYENPIRSGHVEGDD